MEPEAGGGSAAHKQNCELQFSQLLFREFLDVQGMDCVGFREFCCLVLLIAASDSNQLLLFLFQHGALLFDILAGGQ